MSYSLGEKLESYVAQQVAEGPYNNASEVVRDALRMHEEHNVKLEALRRDIQHGVDSMLAGNISRATAQDIIEKAEKRKKAR